MNLLLNRLKSVLVFLCVSFFCISCSYLPTMSENPWEVITLDTDAIFSDIAFTDDPNHGWLVGTKEALFETTDGGETWESRVIDLGEEKVNYTAVSFSGDEGWITGAPAVLLHTNDGGKNWERVLLSEKLPGMPYGVVAQGTNSAEMITNLGAIYKTTDGAKTWKALVEGSVGVARSINRSDDGKYVAVSARGNFYSTWKPGDQEWTPHNRTSSRRLQSMGFFNNETLWMIARGGQVQFTQSEDLEDWGEPINPEYSTSWGFLDLDSVDGENIWLAGGSGNLVLSPDGGESWVKDAEIESVPSNLYNIVLFNEDNGYILGERGVLLRYNTQST